MADIRIEHVVVDGVRSLVREAGSPGAREAVVFVHGNPGSSEDWLDLMAHVPKLARCVAPDMPGYGKAERPRAFPFSVEGYGRYLGGLLDQLGIERAHLVLHDFGGAWGLEWASRHRERVATLTLFNVGIATGYAWHFIARLWRTRLLGELAQLVTTRGRFRRTLNRANPKPLPNTFLDRMFDDADPEHNRAVLRLYRATQDLGALSERYGAALKPLNLPALVVWGEADRFMPVKYAAVQAEYFAAQVHTLPSCGHWPMVDEPERVLGLVMSFLARHVGTDVQASTRAIG